MVNPRTFTEVEVRIHWRGQSWRPAQEPRPAISVEESSRGSLEVSAGQVHPYDVLEVIPEDLDVVHVPKGGLSDVGHPEAGQDSLQPDQEGLQVNDKKHGGQGVSLADGEEDGEDRGDLMEKKRGRSLSVEGGNPASEDLAKSHGLKDAVHPVHADPVISMEEIQTHQETRELVPM